MKKNTFYSMWNLQHEMGFLDPHTQIPFSLEII